MADPIEDNIYAFVVSKQGNGTNLAEIQAWSTEAGLNLYDVNIALKRLFNTGRIYYLRRNMIVANLKKAGAVTQAQPGVRTGSWESASKESWAGNPTPSDDRMMGFKRITL